MRKMRVFQRYRLVKRVMKSIGSHCHERFEYVSKNFSPFSFLNCVRGFLCGGKDMSEGSLPRSNSCGDGGDNISLSGPLK